MAENIGLKITLGGVTEVVSDVEKLKKSIDGAKQTLEGLEQGSEAFADLASEIEIANIALIAFESTADSMDAPQKMTLLSEAGKLVSGAFKVANDTLKVFGIDTEKIGNSARKTFQSLKKPLDDLSESFEKTGKELQDIPGPIGRVAQGVAGLGKALKILLANPIIAIIAGIVAALGLLYKAFTSTKAGAEQMERVFTALGAVVDVLRDRFLMFVDSVGKLFTGDLMGAVKGFRDSFKGIGKEIVDEANEAARLKGILQQVTDATRELSKQRALQNVLLADAKLRINDETLSLKDRIAALNQVREAEIGLAKEEEALGKRKYEALRAQNALSDTSKEALDEEANAYVAYQNLVLQSKTKQKELFDQEKALRDRQRNEQKLQATERLAQLKAQQELVLASLDLEIKQYEKLKNVISEAVPEPPTLVALKALLQAQKDLIKSADDKTFEELFTKQFDEVIPSITAASEEFDLFGQNFLQSRKALVSTLTGLPEEFNKVTMAIREEMSDNLQLGNISKVAFDAMNQILTDYENVNKAINSVPLGGLFNQEEYFKLVKNVKVSNGEITKDVTKTLQGVITGTTKVAKQSYEESTIALQKYQKAVEDDFVQQEKNTKRYKSGSDAFKKDLELKAKERAAAFLNTINTNSDAVIKQEQIIIGFFDQSDKIQKERRNLNLTAQLAFVKQNTDVLLKDLSNVYDINSQDIEIAFDEQMKKIIGSSELTEEQLKIQEKLYQEFYRKLNEMREKDTTSEKTAAEKREELITDLQTGIQEFQGVLNSLNQATNDYYSLQFEALEAQNKKIQDSIIGTNKEAIQKRLEAEQIYAEKRKQLEKQQAVTSLRIGLAQSLANVAQSITAAFKEGPIIGSIAAGLIAAIGVYQTSLISQQISQIQNFQRGGKIRKAQGGIVVGPSHEFGGVKYQGGGIELEGGETVVNRVSSVRYNDLLNQINVSGGGKPLVSNNFDDSRIVEAIARQRSEPIRAYVLESEITNKQGINRRLEQLSSL
jgi:hypothetical protein